MAKNYFLNLAESFTLESRIIGGVGIIGGLEIAIIFNNNRGGGGGWGVVGRGWKNSVGGLLVLICWTKHNAFFFFFSTNGHMQCNLIQEN